MAAEGGHRDLVSSPLPAFHLGTFSEWSKNFIDATEVPQPFDEPQGSPSQRDKSEGKVSGCKMRTLNHCFWSGLEPFFTAHLLRAA